jgi:hypothetical protein
MGDGMTAKIIVVMGTNEAYIQKRSRELMGRWLGNGVHCHSMFECEIHHQK